MRVGIIGLGLMGGSIAKALKKKDKNIHIVATDKNISDLEIALNDNIIDEYSTDIDNSFSALDYIFISTPVKYIVDIARKLEKIVDKNTLVTDIGSTKGKIVEKMETFSFRYIGTHPMVGKEKSGLRYADALLYDNSYFLITKTNNTKEEDIERIKEIIGIINAKPLVIPLEKHDNIVAIISHIPHIVAFSLVNMVSGLEDENHYLKTLAAGGFKDITRIASSSATMWNSICIENREEILKNISNFKRSLEEIEKYISESDEESITCYIKKAKEFRDSVDTVTKANEICIRIENTPGKLKRIVSILADNNLNIINLSILDDVDEKHGTLKLYFENVEKKEKAQEVLKNMIV